MVSLLERTELCIPLAANNKQVNICNFVHSTCIKHLLFITPVGYCKDPLICHTYYLYLLGVNAPVAYFNDLFILSPEDLEWSQPNTSGVPPSQRASMGVAYTAGLLFVYGGVSSTGMFCLIWIGSDFSCSCTLHSANLTVW
jgi:hypothetical protein